MVNATPRPLYPREGDSVPIVSRSGWAPGPVCTDAENLSLTRIRFPNRPARSESLYRPRCPGSNKKYIAWIRILQTELRTRVMEDFCTVFLIKIFLQICTKLEDSGKRVLRASHPTNNIDTRTWLYKLHLCVVLTQNYENCKLLTYLFHGAESFLRS